MSTTDEIDVAIVGYGPVGVVAANLLGGYGIRTVVLERDAAIYPRARAVTVNDWTMRIFQQLGLAAEAKADMEVNDLLRWKTYGGKVVFQLSNPSSGLGHAGSYMIYQPAMETTLRRGVERFASTVDLRFGQTVAGVEQDADGVILTTESGDVVRARYVLACDGGSSRTRAAVGSELVGSTIETTWIIIDADVLRFWPGANDLTFWADPDRPAVDIPLSLGLHRWEIPLRAGEKESDFESDEAVWALLRPLGVTEQQVRLRQHAFYSHHSRRADRWRAGRVFLVGDSAHLMPPWAGQGMQSGIRDAHNLVWKLREVLAGRLDDAVLDTYQPEREPHVAAVTERSQRMGMLIASRDPRFVRLRNLLGPVIMRLPFLVRRLMPPPAAPALGAGWVCGDVGVDSVVGRMLPQPPVWNATGRGAVLDDALGDGFAVVALDADPRDLVRSADLEAWERLGARFVTVRSLSSAAVSDTDLIDHTGELARWFERYGTRVVAVRPDRFTAASGGSASSDAALPTPSPVTTPARAPASPASLT